MTNQRQSILNYIASQYGIAPQFLWQKFPSYAVLRHSNKKAKWFALIADVPKAKLGLEGEGKVDILNLKCDPEMISILLQDPHIRPAYHMNKKHWFTILLDQGFAINEIYQWVDWSYKLTE